MYTLYWSEGTASFAPQALLMEAGLAHELVLIDISASAHKTPEFRRINPAGQVPVLGMPDGSYLTQSSAICLFLADRHRLEDLAPTPDDPDRARFLQSLFYLATSVQDSYKRFYYPERYAGDPAHEAATKAQSLVHLRELWARVDRQLKSHGPFHLGERFSLVDIYALMLVTWYDPQQELLDLFPNLKVCCDLVMERPAIQACLTLQSKISIGR